MISDFKFLSFGAVACALSTVPWAVEAYEYENSVPLTITAVQGAVSIKRVAIHLHGREVVIATELRNGSNETQPVAFYATTPLFGHSGIGEEYLDKSFSDLTVAVNGRARQVTTTKRGFFMGQDITAMLHKAGLGPLPDIDADWKKVSRLPKVQGVRPEYWQGLVVHGWTDLVPPQRATLHQVRYRSMPQFALEELASARFDGMVRQHCGDPAVIRERLKQVGGEHQQALIERYDFPLPYMSSSVVGVEVVQPGNGAFSPQPVVTLVCGISNSGGARDISGLIDGSAQSIGVLVISMLKPQ